ncbi:MAG: tetratricopeptide repeat protein [Synechococcaceae cyanobacterium]|nr:tetratricopeptide repeat protein [Synechococcaceae cyanobacterium]
MPPLTRRLQPRPILLLLPVVVLSLAAGWWLGRGGQPPRDARLAALDREAVALRQRLDRQQAGDGERQRLLELLVALNRRGEAIALLEPLADREPDRWALRLMLAELRRGTGDRSGAERELRQILNRWPGQVEALQLMALLRVEQGSPARAEAEVRAAFIAATRPTLQPQALDLGLLLAELQQKRSNRAGAQATYLELARLFPTDQRPLVALAVLLHGQGNLDAAQEALAQARLRTPDQSRTDPRLDRLAAAWGLEKLRGTEPSAKPRNPPSSERTGPPDP